MPKRPTYDLFVSYADADQAWVEGYLLDALNQALLDLLDDIARRKNATPAQVALAWLRSQPGTIIPIVGSRRVDQFSENLGCLDVQLTGDHVQRLSALSQPRLGFPHEFLASDGVRRLIYGETFDRLDLGNRPQAFAGRA